jgi:hypothetical protein
MDETAYTFLMRLTRECSMNRRQFLGTTGALVSGPAAAAAQPVSGAVFDRAIVLDALSADQEWDAATFEGPRQSSR